MGLKPRRNEAVYVGCDIAIWMGKLWQNETDDV